MLDFLFFHLTHWFERNSDRLKWSTPLQRSCYAIGLASAAFLGAVEQLLKFTVLKGKDINVSKLVFVLAALSIMQIYEFIYATRGRYDKINQNKHAFEGTGVVISIAIVAFAIFSPAIVFVIFVPFGT